MVSGEKCIWCVSGFVWNCFVYCVNWSLNILSFKTFETQNYWQKLFDIKISDFAGQKVPKVFLQIPDDEGAEEELQSCGCSGHQEENHSGVRPRWRKWRALCLIFIEWGFSDNLFHSFKWSRLPNIKLSCDDFVQPDLHHHRLDRDHLPHRPSSTRKNIFCGI